MYSNTPVFAWQHPDYPCMHHFRLHPLHHPHTHTHTHTVTHLLSVDAYDPSADNASWYASKSLSHLTTMSASCTSHLLNTSSSGRRVLYKMEHACDQQGASARGAHHVHTLQAHTCCTFSTCTPTRTPQYTVYPCHSLTPHTPCTTTPTPPPTRSPAACCS